MNQNDKIELKEWESACINHGVHPEENVIIKNLLFSKLFTLPTHVTCFIN